MTTLIDFISLTSWSFWLVAGIALLVIEILTPSFLALGFGVGAICVSALIAFVFSENWLSGSLVVTIWALISGMTWIGFRIVFKNRFSGNDADDNDINEY